ncbi:MAG TPA: PA14 domain-containing protein [Chitinophagaceae bacterium]
MGGQIQSDFGTRDRTSNGLEGNIYALSPDTRSLPDFDTMQSLGKVYAKELNIPARSWTEGFPGITDRFEWFAIEYKGIFTVKKPGRYTFMLSSDDGSRLFIDNELVIDNDGVHGEVKKTGEIDLKKNKHEIEIQYFQGPRMQIALQLYVKSANETQAIFPGNNFILTTPGNGKSMIGGYIFPVFIILFIFLFFFYRRYRRKRKTISTAQ